MTAQLSPSLTTERLCALIQVPFSSQQLDAITAPLEPGLVVAGAGSGKTTVMAARVVWLVATGSVAPHQVLGLTFTNKAAAELRMRVRALLTRAGLEPPSDADGMGRDDPLAEPTVLTYHAYAGQLLKDYGLLIGQEPDVTVLVDASRFQLAERAVRRHRRPILHLTTSLPHVVRYVLDLDAQLSEHLVTPDDVRTWQRNELTRWAAAKPIRPVTDVLRTFETRAELLGLVEDYRELKAQVGVLDFSDAMAAGARLAERHREVGERERDSFRVVLLDEYQDTSIAQASLLQALFSASGPAGPSAHPVTAVGDPCQAIYGWRGASASNLDAFPDHFPSVSKAEQAPARRYPLNVNRRSRTRVLDTANRLAWPLYSVHVGSSPLAAPLGTAPGQVRAAVLETFDDELDFLAREMPRTHQDLGCRWSDIAVLVRDNSAAAAVHDRLVAAEVPVEVVGLGGLLALPEIADVVATLEALHDVTANAALLQLLTSTRWNVGHRDLALLGRRARELAAADQSAPASLPEALRLAVAGTDPADAVCLLEALHDPGQRHYSAAARERFEALARELRGLQTHLAEPLLDLVRRVIDTIGIDIELAASTSRLAESRRDNVATFVEAVAAFAGTGADASLAGLLAYLRAEEEYAAGLALATPTASDSVKVLTVHKAKGLEWDVVFVPGLTREVFPTSRTRAKWTAAAHQLPWPMRGDAADMPEVPSASRQGLQQFGDACRDYELLEERRLGYVAFTRARQILVASGYWWGPRQVQMRGPSEFLDTVIESVRACGGQLDADVPRPADDAANPANRKLTAHGWPVHPSGAERERRAAAAALVEKATERGWRTAAADADAALTPAERDRVVQWDLEIARLVEEVRATTAGAIPVPLPRSMSATTAMRLRDDPAGLARDLARPMPRQPSPSARFGTRFHAWVEAYFGQQQLLPVEELPGRGDDGVASDADLQRLVRAFSDGPFGDLTPHRIEAPFSLVLGGRLIRGRIDAIYETSAGYRVVDWKTNVAPTADPLQLAIYRVAWAELAGVDVADVNATFYYVRTGDVVELSDLPDRSELDRLLSSAGSPAVP